MNHLSIFFGIDEPAERSGEVGEVSVQADIQIPLILDVGVLAVLPGGELLVFIAEGPTEHSQVMTM